MNRPSGQCTGETFVQCGRLPHVPVWIQNGLESWNENKERSVVNKCIHAKGELKEEGGEKVFFRYSKFFNMDMEPQRTSLQPTRPVYFSFSG